MNEEVDVIETYAKKTHCKELCDASFIMIHLQFHSQRYCKRKDLGLRAFYLRADKSEHCLSVPVQPWLHDLQSIAPSSVQTAQDQPHLC